jgi:hypothetical protein
MNTLGRAYERGFEDGSAGREFAPPYVKPVNRDLYAHGYYSGEYAFQPKLADVLAPAQRRHRGDCPLTKKHFQQIADMIRHWVPSMPHGVEPITPDQLVALREDLAKEWASMLAQTNPRFDRGRFLAACASNR